MIETIGKTYETVAKIVKELNRSRSCVITVENRSTRHLDRSTENHSSGQFGELPADRIGPDQSNTFGTVSSAGSLATGAIGSMQYNVGAMGECVWTIRWRNPFLGPNRASTKLSGPKAHLYVVDKVTGGGNDTKMRFTIRGGPKKEKERVADDVIDREE